MGWEERQLQTSSSSSHVLSSSVSSLTIRCFSETKLWCILLCRLVYYLILRRLKCDRRIDKNPVRSLSTGLFYPEKKNVEPCVSVLVTVFSKVSSSRRLDQIRSNFISLFCFCCLYWLFMLFPGSYIITLIDMLINTINIFIHIISRVIPTQAA